MSSIQLEDQGMATAGPDSVTITFDSDCYGGASPLQFHSRDTNAIPDFDLECPQDFLDGAPLAQMKRKRSTSDEGRVREGGSWSLPRTSPLQVGAMRVLPPQPQPAAPQPQPAAPQPQYAALQQHELDVARQWLNDATVHMIPPEKKERQASNCKVIDKTCHVKPDGYFRLEFSGNLRNLYARVCVVFNDEDNRDMEPLSCNMHWKRHTEKCLYSHPLEKAFCCSKTLSVYSKVGDWSNSQRSMGEITSLWDPYYATRDVSENGKKMIKISAICRNSCTPDGNKEAVKRSTVMIVELVAVSPATAALLDIKPKMFKFDIICCQAPTRDSKAKHSGETSGNFVSPSVKKEPIVKKEISVDTVSVVEPYCLPLSFGLSREPASPMYPPNMPIKRYQFEVETMADQKIDTALELLRQLAGFRVKQVQEVRTLYSASDSPL